MLELKKLEVREAGYMDVVYSATHTTPGREGTHLEIDVSLRVNREMQKTWVAVKLDPELNTVDTDVALDKLAEWAERLAISLRSRGPASVAVVAFDQPGTPKGA